MAPATAPPQPAPQSVIIAKAWDGLRFEYGQLRDVGEFDFAMPQQAISVAFAPHDRVTWSVDGGSKQTTALPAGSVFVYGDCTFAWHERHQVSEYANFLFDDHWLKQVAAENELTLHSSSSGTIQFDHRVIFADPTILHVAQLLRSEVQAEGAASGLLVESLRNVLAVHLLRHYAQAERPPANIETANIKKVAQTTLEPFQFQRVKDYIEENLGEDLAIAQLAALIPMSQFHFARAFKASLGQTPHKYITQRRIERAKVLLSVTQLPVLEIAAQTGFSNPSHFTAQFRKHTGATPKQFRDRR